MGKSQPQLSRGELMVEVRRGGVTESLHSGHFVAVDGDGRILARLGDPGAVTYLRSSAKPFQALPLVSTGAADRFGFTDAEVALACGSHNGDPAHTETAAAMLRKLGLDEGALQCGAHEPYGPETARRLREERREPTALHNNCSGNHAGMLALALHLGADAATYLQPEHPAQQLITRAVAQFSGVPAGDIHIGVDGCGAPVHALPLRAMALMYARLVVPPAGEDSATRAACARIVEAMTSHPAMIGGETESLDTALMRAGPAGLLAKAGAEGLFTAALGPCAGWPRGLGLALKIEDGDKGSRARRPAVVEAFAQLGLLPARALESLAQYARTSVSNHRGEEVGEARALFELREENLG